MFFKKRFLKKFKEKLYKIRLKNNQKFLNSKKEFSKTLRHDVKTVLLAQNNCLELLLKGKFGQILPNQEKIIAETLSSNSFLIEIINNMIFLFDTENKPVLSELEKVDIINETKSCMTNIKKIANNKNQNLIFNHFENKIQLNANKKFIEKIIYNILIGCVSYGFEKSDIIVSIEENEKEILFSAKNKSLYMTREKLNDIFKNNTNNDFNQLGMKLNLNVAKKLVDLHHWDFIAQSDKLDNSSTFGFVVKK